MKLKKSLGEEYAFKSHCISINEFLSKLQGCQKSRRKNLKIIFQPFDNKFLQSSKNIILKVILLFIRRNKYICDYNTICFMSSVVMNMISNKVLKCHVKVVDCYFTKIDNRIIYMYRGHLNTFTRRKELVKFFMLYVYISILK